MNRDALFTHDHDYEMRSSPKQRTHPFFFKWDVSKIYPVVRFVSMSTHWGYITHKSKLTMLSMKDKQPSEAIEIQTYPSELWAETTGCMTKNTINWSHNFKQTCAAPITTEVIAISITNLYYYDAAWHNRETQPSPIYTSRPQNLSHLRMTCKDAARSLPPKAQKKLMHYGTGANHRKKRLPCGAEDR